MRGFFVSIRVSLVRDDRANQVTQGQPTEQASSRPQMRRVRATIA